MQSEEIREKVQKDVSQMRSRFEAFFERRVKHPFSHISTNDGRIRDAWLDGYAFGREQGKKDEREAYFPRHGVQSLLDDFQGEQ